MTITPIANQDRSNIPEVVGSNPTPATKVNTNTALQENGGLYSFQPELERCYTNVMASKDDSSNLQSILSALQKLSPADRQAIVQTLQSGPASILKTPGDGLQDWQSDLWGKDRRPWCQPPPHGARR